MAKEIPSTHERIKKYIRQTPLEYSPNLSGSANVFLKLESIQFTRSFKVRGALNKLLSLSDLQRTNGIITASTGNHGMATAFALKMVGGQGTIVVPENIVSAKLKKLQQYDVDIKFFGTDSSLSELHAKQIAKDSNLPYISPYNDKHVIAGQGTIAVELVNQIEKIDHLFVTVGGGGLISGIGAYTKKINPNIKIVGCLPQNSPVMYESIKQDRIVEMKSKDTLSDGSAGGIEPDAITFELVKELVDEFELVSEGEIAHAMKQVFDFDNLVIEGAAGTAVAAYFKQKNNLSGNVVIIVCGGNIGMDSFKSIIC